MKLHVGTSGFGYKEWKGKFYPPGQSPKKLLAYYAEHFEAVEINNTFLGLPTLSVLQAWASQVPTRFRFAFKAPRQITHSRRLKDVQEPLHALLDRIGHLGDQAGPVLFQLQSNFKKDLDRLRQFLAILPPTCQAAFEFRHASWFEDDVLALMRDHNVACCVSDKVEGLNVPFADTSNWGYLRLRQCEYSDSQLSETLQRMTQQRWREAYVFFKHEAQATGPNWPTGSSSSTRPRPSSRPVA